MKNNSSRSRRFPVRPAFAAAAVFLLAAAVGAGSPEGTVSGKLVVKGKSLAFSRAWLVRGPDTFDKTKPSSYVVLSAADLSPAIAACKDLSCVLWDTVRNGAILQPVDDGHESFWLRIVSPELAREQQISGRRWIPSLDRRDRLTGRLLFSYVNTGEEADLAIDAPLAREFPLVPPPAATPGHRPEASASSGRSR